MNRNKPAHIMAGCSAIAFACFLFSSSKALAVPVTTDAATSVVQGWLHQDRQPLGKALSASVKGTQAVTNAAGKTLYFVVHLDPSGFVILPADDLVDPVIAFSATGSFDAASKSPLATLVNRDLPRRMARARTGAPPTAAALKSRHKWQALLAGSPNPPPDSEENSNIVVVSQIWVAPFVQTLWSQQTDVSLGDACYNYYTPPYASGNLKTTHAVASPPAWRR